MYNGYGYNLDIGGGGGTIIVSGGSDVPQIITGKCPRVDIECETREEDLEKDAPAVSATLTFTDGDAKLSLPITLKRQGSGSAQSGFKTRNLNVKLLKDDDSGDSQKVRFNDWYATAKYHLKVNPQDPTIGKNGACAKIVHEFTCGNYPQGAMAAIDSFPIILYYNGEYRGCYAWCLPQDGKTFNFSKKKEKAYKNLAYRNDLALGTGLGGFVPNAWEYRGDEDLADTSVFDRALAVCRNIHNVTKSDFEAVFDKQNTFVYLLFTDILGLNDNYQNNITLATWDGAKWYWTFYDMDQAFAWGNQVQIAQYMRDRSELWTAIYDLYEDDFPAMYAKLRDGGVTPDNLYKIVSDYYNCWGWENWEATREFWGPNGGRSLPGTLGQTLASFSTFFNSKIAVLDTFFGYNG